MWRRGAVLWRLQSRLSSSYQQPWIPPSFAYSDAPSKKGKAAPLQERRMVDRFRLRAKGGEGGNGCWSNRRSRSDRHGKPDGGNGGRGGDVILECSSAVWDFSNLQHHLNAKRGGHGVSKNKIGSRGSDKVAQVPVGTVIHLVTGEIPSFLEHNSNTSSDPWEMPGAVEVDPSKSAPYSDDCLGQSRSSKRKTVQDLSSSAQADFEKSASVHHRDLKSSAWNEVDSKSFEDSFACSETCDVEIEKVEHGSDAYNMELEEDEEMEDEDEDDDDDDEEEEEEEEVVQYSVAELTEPGQRILVARGGDGGLGNASLKKDKKLSLKNDASNPELYGEEEAPLTSGMPGSEAVVILELKSIADVGLVGIPNAGKSTLLGALSRAKPTVGDYAFTTLRPNIGNLNYVDFSMTVADIPGLIKGAHENRGLGHAFLRHIERTKVLAYVVDLAAALDGRKGIPPWEQLRDLVLELEFHQEGLSKRPSLVVANKIDEDGAEDVYEDLKRRVHGIPIFPVCAILEEGIPDLKAGLRSLMDGSESQAQQLELNNIMID